jgi:hypothetical protein
LKDPDDIGNFLHNHFQRARGGLCVLPVNAFAIKG